MTPMQNVMLAKMLRERSMDAGPDLVGGIDGLAPLPPSWSGNAQPGSEMMGMEYLGGMSPEQLNQSFTPYEEKSALLNKQANMAQQLREPKSGEHSTAIGSIFGGLGDMVNSGVGAYNQGQAMSGMEELLKQKQASAGRNAQDYARFAMGKSGFGF